jgi:hypothetical protein
MSMSSLTPVTLLLGALLALGACGSKQNVQPQCDDDSMCPGSAVCMMGKCLSRGGERTVAIDILPNVNSSSMRTSLPAVTLSSERLDLNADERVLIKGTVTDAPDARLVLALPSPIPGLGNLRLETVLTNSQFELGIGRRLLAVMGAVLWLTPAANDTQPPAAFHTMLNTTLGLAFPTISEMTPIRGKLLNLLDAAQSGYLARAVIGGQVVSNTTMTGPAGDFQLLIAPGSLPESPAKSVNIEFTRTTGIDALRFLTVPLDPNGTGTDKPTVFHLPAFPTPVPLRFGVQGKTMAGTQGSTAAQQGTMPLSGVSIRFRTQLLDNKEEGTGIFEREVQTVGGEAEVYLIPGTAAASRKYEIAIVPPPDSGYAALCVPDQPVTTGGNVGGSAPYGGMFALDPKVRLTGTVIGDDGKPASQVNVRATFIQGNTLCANVTSSPTASSVTDLDGAYVLLLDPGMYRLDVEPPAGAPWPRQTEDGEKAVAVAAGSAVTTHDIKLPAGEVVIGHVHGADMAALEDATVSIFEVLCMADTCSGSSRIPPALRAQTTTGPQGEFRAVLPVLPLQR